MFERGYDDNKIYNYISINNHKFIVRVDEARTVLFKGKRRNVEEVSKLIKGEIIMKTLFDNDEEYELYLSYTKATLPY